MAFIDTSSGTPAYQVQSPPMSRSNTFNGFGSIKNYNRDMGGTESAMFNYWMQQQKNAYDLELWNLNNQYNSPAEQMKRYAAAGLNPNLIYNQQNTSGGPASSSNVVPAKATNFKAQNTIQGLQAATAMVRSASDLMGAVKDVYSYSRYGMTAQDLRNQILVSQANIADAQAGLAQNEAKALSWYYGNGLAYNSPFMLDKTAARNQVLSGTALNQANVRLAGSSYDVNRQRINESMANVLKINAETGRIEVDTKRLEAAIQNLNSDTAVKNYMLRYMYPQMYDYREQQLRTLPYQRGLIQQQILMNDLRYKEATSKNPFWRIKTGYDWLDDTLRHFGQFGLNFYEGLPIFNTSDYIGSLGKYLF